MPGSPSPVVLAPLKVDAFVLNESLCARSDTFKICPITQPNYTFLRLTDSLLTADILDHVDLHVSTPAELNSRITDLGTGQIHANRLGVYVKWTLPPVYRSGAAAVNAADPSQGYRDRKLQAGYPKPAPGNADPNAIQMRPVPNRWIVIRRLDMNTISPKGVKIPPVQAWLIESDRMRNINDADLASSDLEVDVVPFVNLESTAGDSVIDGQAEVFIGSKTLIYPTVGKTASTPAYINLDVLTSANPLFADYQPHNGNVFSMLDNFAYDQNGGCLTEARADYQVIGWHSDQGDDPFSTDSTISIPPSHMSRLQALEMRLKAPVISNPDKASSNTVPWIESPNFGSTWLSDNAQTRLLTHGTMYGVHWKGGPTGRPGTCLADAAAANFKKQPISIGATPLDALYAYCRVHDTIDTDSTLVRMEKDLEALHDLLQTTEDGDVDALQASQDESYEQAFSKFEGETHWFFYGNTPNSNQPVIPSPTDKLNLATLNSLQRALDMSQKEVTRAKWELFAIWWNFVSALDAKTTTQMNAYTPIVKKAKDDLKSITACYTQLQTAVTEQLKMFTSNSPQKGTGGRFFQRKDPTIMFGGIKNGWEPDFSDVLPVRLADQTVMSTTNASSAWGITTDVTTKISANLPATFSKAVGGLLSEFQALSPQPNPPVPSGFQTLPWFQPDPRLQQSDRTHWNETQPWQPLFIEWEAIYVHIPWNLWKLKRMQKHSQWGHKVYKYAVTGDLASNPPKDTRTVSGRFLILPQASSTLRNTLNDLFKSTNPQDLIDKYGMTTDEQNFALANASSVQFVSSPLNGLTSHLLTLQQGSHLKPTMNLPNQRSTPIPAATADSIGKVGFLPADLLNMESDSAATPYGATPVDATSTTPLKLVTHGQLMFTKINVIDKFGQAICAIDPSPRHRKQPIPTISPCLGDTYFPDLIGIDPKAPGPTGRQNTVFPSTQFQATTSTPGSVAANNRNDCPFVQLTPAINFPARINASFFMKGIDGAFQLCSEWDNPIWGWLVVNYADYGLQIFRQDGTFYREVRLGGPTGASAGLKWLPFDPPPSTTPADTGAASDIQQLEFLIGKLSSTTSDGQATYMEAFFSMIEQSLEMNQAAAPSSYSSFASAIVGKPLALVNVGYSLELSGPEPKNWSTVNILPADMGFLKDPTNTKKGFYTFDYKLGDVERTFDGLVGYFKTKPTKNNAVPGLQSDYDLDNLYTFFTDGMAPKGDPRKQLDDDVSPHFENLTPYWTGLPDTTTLKPTDPSSRDNFAKTLATSHQSMMTIFGAICDPFLPIHAYSGILPNMPLKLPSWTVEQAMAQMTAFWHSGPLIVTQDVPAAYNISTPLDANYSKTLLSATLLTEAQAALLPPVPTVGIPLAKPISSASGGQASYKWLQPYALSTTTNNVTTTQTKFNPIDISGDSASGADASMMRLENGPYTALEGFVQLAKPIVVAPGS